MNIALAQINPIVGDVEGNTLMILERLYAAKARRADLVVFPELSVMGYPPRDLVLRSELVGANVEAVHRIADACDGITAIVGFVNPCPDSTGGAIQNAAAVCRDGRVTDIYAKRLLPTYDVFDEARYFTPGRSTGVISIPTAAGPVRVGLTICEDVWDYAGFYGHNRYDVDPVQETVHAGAEVLVNIGASPFVAGKQADRETIFRGQARSVCLVSVNQVGGNDDLIFDGASFVLDRSGRIVARLPAFEEALGMVDPDNPKNATVAPYPDRVESIRAGLVLGIRDYLRKCGFREVVLGLSGGIDSAVTAALAVEALGADRVHGVAMPSRFSSDHSREDASALAEHLNIDFRTISIEAAHSAMEETLKTELGDAPPGVAEENIQARVRGTILMALSNKFGWLLLTTGNKSELAVGYCTLYGDMCGGLAVLSDVPKTTVYALADWLNKTWNRPCIPRRTITKPPSAELRPNQKDQDTLPDYAVLDAVLERCVERDGSLKSIVADGFDAHVVAQILGRLAQSEYKRRQAPIGLKVTTRAFGTGRRMPIAARPAANRPRRGE
ncbi:MAG: NAD+ synthase [Phycisphaerae bacterium]